MKLSELIERMQRNIDIWGDPEITQEKLVRIYQFEIESAAHEEQPL